jgi:hypothetical protein
MIKKLLFLLFITSSLFSVSVFSADTCSRIAIINYQEVLVDPSNTAKGEGLRFYLERDDKAKEFLKEYQDQNSENWQSAALSSLGTGLIFTGILKGNSDSQSGLESKNSLMFTGAIFIALSYLTAKTIKYQNEHLLKKSVQEYNKRNLPRIYFSPYHDGNSGGFGFGILKDF